MTDWLEFHDSRLLRLDATDTDVELLLDGYIHRWERADGGWRGTGWMQGVRIVVSDAIGPSVLPALPEAISDGWLQLGSAPTRGFLRLPLNVSGVARIWLQLTNAEVVDLTGRVVRIETTADARYVEGLPLDMLPPDAD